MSQRAGDSYIDAEAIWLTAYQAAWRLSAGLPADREIAIAKYWACEGGYRVVHAAVHVHGGVGVDRDYPLHRHFLAARHMELTFGHAEEQLVRCPVTFARVGCSRLACDYSGHGQAQTYKRLWTPH